MSDMEIRVADADRERVAEQLRAAAGDGRLTPDELEDRLDAAFGARTQSQLDPLVADLPAPARTGRPARGLRLRAEQQAFLATAVLLVGIWALSGMGYFWPAWPILGWGVFAFAPGKSFGCRAAGRRRRRAAT